MKHRALSTFAALFVLALSCSVRTVFAQSSAGGLSPHQQLAREIFREVVEINTTMNVGSTKAAEAMAARLKAAGFVDNDMELVGPRPQNKNLVVRYRGKGIHRPIVIIAHLDVVEALRQDWSFDPFTFLEKAGFFYGRGASDMKCEVADIVATFIRLKNEGFVPSRDIILALTEHEENGDANGVQWLLANRRDLIDAEFGINLEGGGGDIEKGKPILLEVQTSEKVYVSFELEVKNKGGHSSIPVKDNAIYRLAAGLARLSQVDFPVRLNETTRTFFGRTAQREEGQTKSDMLAILKTPIDEAAANRLAASKPYYNALMRTTWVPTMLNGGHAENALPQSARAVVNCRMLPDEKVETVLAMFHLFLADSQITVTQIAPARPGPLSPLRKDVMDAVDQLAASMWPGVTVTPVMSTGASDGKFLRQAGIPVYGVSGMFADIDDVRAHGRDERLGAKEFYDGVEFMYRFLRLLNQ
ncbi:MAG: M20/M25/M40 family metallo-hydrolase [Ignavibacteriales bacterium]|nr:M20/M25/M40 family metallo-hydrolase [Ignavibacteriales bacterium]